MARTHISHARLMKIIDAYSRWETAGVAAEKSGVSRLTTARIYNLIRQRLLDCRIFQSDEDYRNARYGMENDEDEYGTYWFSEERHEAGLAAMLGRYRGIDPAFHALYEAEAVFRLTRPQATAGEVKTYIMEAIRTTGPLNEKPQSDRLAEVYAREFMRREFDHIGKEVRRMIKIAADLRGPNGKGGA